MKNVGLLLERQHIHLGLLVVLLAGISIVVKTGKFMDGQILSIDTVTWFVLAIAIAVLHQVYVLFCWRVQLHYSLITRLFGWNGFTYYSTGFFILAILRIIFVIHEFRQFSFKRQVKLEKSEVILTSIQIFNRHRLMVSNANSVFRCFSNLGFVFTSYTLNTFR